MRKCNAVLSTLLLLLLAAHGILGAALMAGLSSLMLQKLARALCTLVAVHTILGILLTTQSLKVWRRTGAPYWRENQSFWIRRFSGLAMLLFMGLHMALFVHRSSGAPTLNGIQLLTQLLFVLSILVHGISNVKPLCVAMGSQAGKQLQTAVCVVLSLLALFFAAGLIIYFGRCAS